jgi:acylphosphatase
VEAVFEGAPEDVDALASFFRRGPEGAVVDRLEEIDDDPEGLSGFQIR